MSEYYGLPGFSKSAVKVANNFVFTAVTFDVDRKNVEVVLIRPENSKHKDAVKRILVNGQYALEYQKGLEANIFVRLSKIKMAGGKECTVIAIHEMRGGRETVKEVTPLNTFANQESTPALADKLALKDAYSKQHRIAPIYSGSEIEMLVAKAKAQTLIAELEPKKEKKSLAYIPPKKKKKTRTYVPKGSTRKSSEENSKSGGKSSRKGGGKDKKKCDKAA
jgi:hypothetical protein